MGRHSMDYNPESDIAAGSGSLAPVTPIQGIETPDFAMPNASIAPPGGPIDPGVPGAPDAPSYPEGPGFPETPAPSPSEPGVTPPEPDPIPEDSTGSPAHYGHWFAADDEQAS